MGVSEKPLHLARHQLTVGEYYRMAEVGLLRPDARTELIEGEVIDMAAIGTRHASTVTRLMRLFELTAAERAVVSVQNPLRLGDRSEPEPDLMLLVPREDFYASAHPVPADVWLLVEVSDTTLRYDTEIKLPLYAQHGVPEVWVFDLENAVLRRYRQPAGDAYTMVETLARPGLLVPDAAPALALDLGAVPLGS